MSEVEAIRDLVAQAVEFQSDVERFIPLHTEEVSIVNFGGRRVLGRDVLEGAMKQALASPLADVPTTVEVEDVRFLREDVALVAAVKTVYDQRDKALREGADTALPATRGQLTYVVVKEGGAWRIASAQTTPILG